jgi:predicted transcriptional regulator
MIKLFSQNVYKGFVADLKSMEPLLTPPHKRKESFRLVIRRIERPLTRDPAVEFNYLCESLGFFEPIDKEKTAASLFKEIVKSTENSKGITSIELIDTTGMSRGSVMNHLHNLQRAGLVQKQGRQYFARGRSMQHIVKELEEDVSRVFKNMEIIAKELDSEFFDE